MIVLTLTIGRCLNKNIFQKGDGFITVEGVIIVLGTAWLVLYYFLNRED